jgi:F0F1-type ATP synthase membrane subunit c/vacuolar-type H+-ATPase subunit K
MRKGLEIGGAIAAVVLVAFGIGAIVLGANGKSTVEDSLVREQIVGTPDMTPAVIKEEVSGAGLAGKVDLPSCSVAEESIDSGGQARCFAEYMRVHSLLATGGYTYSEMGRYEALANTPKAELAPGGGTENEEFAAIDPETKQPVENPARQVWVTSTALSTALNASYMADQTALFGIVVGIALLLSGIGFGVLVAAGAVRNPDTAIKFLRVRAVPHSS